MGSRLLGRRGKGNGLGADPSVLRRKPKSSRGRSALAVHPAPAGKWAAVALRELACLESNMLDNKAASHFVTSGALLFKAAMANQMDQVLTAISEIPRGQAGVRLWRIPALEPVLARNGSLGSIAEQILGSCARPVRAILFDKSTEANWSLGWHQDRTICVKQRQEAPGFGPWTVKNGMIHVAPPFELLARMVTLRAHIDDVPATNAPLVIAPGSHRFGRVAIDQIDELVAKCGQVVCLASAGDVWAYATPILHASDVASAPMSRRVLQVDYAADNLPYGLEWLGV